MVDRAKYYLPEHDVYGLTKEGTLGDSISVRYFHIYYDNIRASQERNEYMKQLLKKEMTASEALDIYRKRDNVEKIFRMLKTGLEYDTFRVHSQESLESKTYVMFMKKS